MGTAAPSASATSQVQGNTPRNVVVGSVVVQPVLRKGSAELRGVGGHAAEQVVSAVRHLRIFVALGHLHRLPEVGVPVLQAGPW